MTTLKSLVRLLAIASAAAQVHAAALSDLSDGTTGRFEYESFSPPNRHLYARQIKAGSTPATISAELLMPKGMAKDAKVPAVVLSHGSGGVESNMRDVWAKELNAVGYAVLIADSYKPRGVTETNTNQERVPYPAHVADTMNALRMLVTHPQIDAARIFNIGFSRGGSTAFDTAWPTWSDPVNTSAVKFAGHVSFYPGNCNIRYRTDDREKATAPILVLLAERDLEEAQDVGVCRRWYDELIAKGNNIRYKEFKGARHGFDTLNFAYRVNPRTTSAKNCDMEMYMTMKAGSGLGNNVYDFKKKQSMTTGPEFTAAANECQAIVPGSRGGGEAKAIQAEAVLDTITFLKSIP
ncbi:dienelactone hydrolase family protein [Acidovorax sp. LjRoot129]|uniref:dienelactone hydrolase family protein n=1 Tax=unclassified Acidovorax TaxID=2684926 RepID=UPI003ECD8AAD